MTQPPPWEGPGAGPTASGPSTPPPPPPAPTADPAPSSATPPPAVGPPPPPPTQPAGPAGYPQQPGDAYSTPGPYAVPTAARPKSGLSVTSFVLGLLGCIPVASIAAIVVGVLALTRKQAMRGLAIAGIVLGALWTVGFIAFFATGTPAKIVDAIEEAAQEIETSGQGGDHTAALGSEVGDCINDPALSPDDALEGTEVVDCAASHDMEVYHVFSLPDGAYPGDDQVTIAAEGGCIEAFEDFIGVSYEKSEFDIYLYYPIQATWTFADDRGVTCAVFDPSGRTTGTLEGANR